MRIRHFLQESLENKKLDFSIFYGNKEKKTFYLYSVSWNDDIRRPEVELIRQETAVFDKDVYLQVNIKTTITIIKSIFNKIRNYLKTTAPKYPNVEIELNATGCSWLKDECLDDKNIRMITDSVSDLIKYGTNFDFRKKVFEMFNCNSKEWLSNQLYQQLCNVISK